jgi:hypothetical protein
LNIGFYSFFIARGWKFWHEWVSLEKGEVAVWHEQVFLGKEKGQFSPWLIAIFWEHMDLLVCPP